MKKKVILVSGLMLSSLTWAEQWHALVIGANHYDGGKQFKTLAGAVNDATEIAKALAAQGVEPTVLLEGEVKYDTIKDWWLKTIQKVGKGDKIFFSFAGHGGQEEEHFPGTEAQNAKAEDSQSNKRDEVLVLPHYQNEGENSKERIVDQELLGWMQAATKKGATVFAVADACYGGGQTRSAQSGKDYGDQLAIVRNSNGELLHPEDKSKRGTPESALLRVEDQNAFNGRLFYAIPSADEDEQVTEYVINNKPHGALSYSIAQIITGQAVNDKGKAIHIADEVRNYLSQTSNSLTTGNQTAFLAGVNRQNKDISIIPQKTPDAAPTVNTEKPKLPTLFAEQGCQTKGVEKFFTPTSEKKKAAFRWNCQTGKVIQTGVGDVAYDINQATDLRGFLEQQSRLAEIRALSLPTFAGGIFPARQTDLSQNKIKIFEQGDRVAIYFAKPRGEVLFVLNLPSKDGIQFLNIINLEKLPLLSTANGRFNASTRTTPIVTPPFGSDHLLFIAMDRSTAKQLPFFNRLLGKPAIKDGASAAEEMILDLKKLSAKQASVAIIPFATTPK